MSLDLMGKHDWLYHLMKVRMASSVVSKVKVIFRMPNATYFVLSYWCFDEQRWKLHVKVNQDCLRNTTVVLRTLWFYQFEFNQ